MNTKLGISSRLKSVKLITIDRSTGKTVNTVKRIINGATIA